MIGWTPLYIAAAKEQVKELIAGGAKINQADTVSHDVFKYIK